MKTVILRMMPYALFLGMAFAAPTTASAQSVNGYNATMAKAFDAPRNDILEGTMWRCVGDSCTGADEGQRPTYICRQVVRKFGPVTNFASKKGALSASDLAKCNGVK